MVVAINAVPTAPGGGLTNLLGLLEGFASTAPTVRFVIFAAYQETIDALRQRGHEVTETPLMSKLHRIRWERHQMPCLLEHEGADLLLCSNFAVPGLRWLQVVQHHDLHPVGGWTMWGSVRRAHKVSMQKIAARYTLRVAAANVFVSDYLRRHAEQAYPASRSHNYVVHYGLSIRYRTVAQSTSTPPAPTYQLAALQSPLEHKDNESLLQALQYLIELHSDKPWRLKVAGWGNWMRWQRRAHQLGVADRVEWLGNLDEDGVIGLLTASDCLVFPNSFESFGLPVIEAMACGCPVVAVASTAIPEVAGGAACLVPKKSPKALAQSVARVCLDPVFCRHLVEAGRRRAQAFSWDTAARGFQRVFRKVCPSDHEPPNLG